jgi:hypothetical protein
MTKEAWGIDQLLSVQKEQWLRVQSIQNQINLYSYGANKPMFIET